MPRRIQPVLPGAVVSAMVKLPGTVPHLIRKAAGVVAVWKPAGLATQAPPGIPSIEAWLRRQLHGESLDGYLGVPHRLDRGVSGVLLFASTPRAARQLSRQFERRQIRKTYLAILACGDADRNGIEPMSVEAVPWCDMIEKIPDEARAGIVPPGETRGREAITLARLDRHLATDRLLVELSPVTGRMHQLRLQAAARGLPVLGDELYGSADAAWSAAVSDALAGEASADDPRTRPIALHASRIVYADPDSSVETTVEAALPDYWPQSAR